MPEAIRDRWHRETPTRYRLDDVWTVRLDGRQWFAYRRNAACLVGFVTDEAAMEEAERLKKEDEAYGNPN